MLVFAKSFLLPSNLAVLFIIIGLSLLFIKKFKHYSVWFLSFGGLIFLVFSTGTMASMLLNHLEYQYPYIKDPQDYPNVKNIVVLTHYAIDDPLIPLSSRVSNSTTYRILETYRLFRSCEKCKIFISGNSAGSKIMKKLLVEIGTPEEAIHEDRDSLHTHNSAQFFLKKTNNEPFFLVTSAGHMPRSIGVFKKLGMNPIPAPTDYLMPNDFLSGKISPSPRHLYWSDLAVLEYAGIAWYKLTSKI